MSFTKLRDLEQVMRSSARLDSNKRTTLGLCGGRFGGILGEIRQQYCPMLQCVKPSGFSIFRR
jgi:hypothetical protein